MESWCRLRGVPTVLRTNNYSKLLKKKLHPRHSDVLGVDNRQFAGPASCSSSLQDGGRMKMTAFAQGAHPCCSRTHVFFLILNAECGAKIRLGWEGRRRDFSCSRAYFGFITHARHAPKDTCVPFHIHSPHLRMHTHFITHTYVRISFSLFLSFSLSVYILPIAQLCATAKM